MRSGRSRDSPLRELDPEQRAPIFREDRARTKAKLSFAFLIKRPSDAFRLGLCANARCARRCAEVRTNWPKLRRVARRKLIGQTAANGAKRTFTKDRRARAIQDQRLNSMGAKGFRVRNRLSKPTGSLSALKFGAARFVSDTGG